MKGERALLAESAPHFQHNGGLWTSAQVLALLVRATERTAAQTLELLAEYFERNGQGGNARALRDLKPEDVTREIDLGETVSETRGASGPRETSYAA